MIYLYIHNQANPEEVKWMFDKYISFLNFLKSVNIIQTNTTLDKPQKVITYFKNNDEYINLTSHGDFLVYKQEKESSSANKILCKLDKQCESLVYEAIRNNTEIPWAQRSQSIKEYCVKCEQFKDSHHFETLSNGKKRDSCYICRNKQEHKREQKRIENNETRTCRSCEIKKTIQGNFDRGSHLCLSCEYYYDKQKYQNMQPPETKKCPKCNTEKNIDDFAFSPDRKNLRKSYCKECYNVQKYYETYRKKKFYEDPIGYLRHKAYMQVLYRRKVIKNRRKDQCKTLTGKMKDICNSAKKEGKGFHKSDKELMKILLSKPCYYCNSYNSDNTLVGLDRINNDGCYEYDNVVPCCGVCNIMKSNMSMEHFIQYISLIVQYSNNESKNNNTFGIKHKRFYGNFEDKQYKKNNNYCDISQSQINEIKTKNCYLCGVPKSGGIDRYDNTKSYTYNNMRPTCYLCNYLKSDLSYDNFIIMCQAINNNNPKIIKGNVCENVEKHKDDMKKEIVKTRMIHHPELQGTPLGFGYYTYENEFIQLRAFSTIKEAAKAFNISNYQLVITYKDTSYIIGQNSRQYWYFNKINTSSIYNYISEYTSFDDENQLMIDDDVINDYKLY